MPLDAEFYKKLKTYDYGYSTTKIKLARRSSIKIYGLFAKEAIRKNEIIAYYPGIIVSDENRGQWSYYKVGTIKKKYVYIPYKRGIFQKASNGISYLAPFSNEPGPRTQANSCARIDGSKKIIPGLKHPKALYLIALKDIKKDEEITWCYGKDYDQLRVYKTSCSKPCIK